MYLDDSLARGGYAAISTFHFGNPDFTNSEPFLMHYRGRIPFVALQDAHGAGAVVVRRHDDRVPHPVPGRASRRGTGWLDRARATTGWSPSAATRSSGGKTWMHAGRGRGGATSSAGARRTGGGGTTRRSGGRWCRSLPVTPGTRSRLRRPEKGVAIRVRVRGRTRRRGCRRGRSRSW